MPRVMGMAKYVPPYDRRERHLPGYNFAGPGTDVNRRIRNRVKPVNELDAACLAHDLDVETRGPRRAKTKREIRASDKRLERKAYRIAINPNTSKQERRHAWVVYYAMRGNRWRPSRRP
jgi:hypothetical protein